MISAPTWQSADSVPGLFPAESSDDEWSDLASFESESEQAADDALDDEYRPPPLRSKSESASPSRQGRDRGGSRRGGATTHRILAIVLICIDTALFFSWASPTSYLRALPQILPHVFNTLIGPVDTALYLVTIVAHLALIVAVIGIGMRQWWGKKWAISSAVTLIASFLIGLVLTPVDRIDTAARQQTLLKKATAHLSEEQQQASLEAIEKYQKENAGKISAAWIQAISRSVVISVAIPVALIICMSQPS